MGRDIIKSLTEVTCFTKVLEDLCVNQKLSLFDRVFKISGRYTLNDNFDYKKHDTSKIVISYRLRSQFSIVVTGVRFQYMSRLWSWPVCLSELILDSYKSGFNYLQERINRDWYSDIEHMLYKKLPEHLILSIHPLGVQGFIGPSGEFISE